MTFGEFVEREYVPFALANKKSAKTDVNKLRRDILPLWGKLPLTAIGTKDVQALCTRIRTESSPTYANRYYSLVHRIFNLAILWGKLDGRFVLCRDARTVWSRGEWAGTGAGPARA